MFFGEWLDTVIEAGGIAPAGIYRAYVLRGVEAASQSVYRWKSGEHNPQVEDAELPPNCSIQAEADLQRRDRPVLRREEVI